MALLYDYYTRPAFGASLDQKPDPNAQRILLDGTEQFPDPSSNPWTPSWYDGLGSAFFLGVGRGLLGTNAAVMEAGSGALTGLNDNVWAEQAAESAKRLRAKRNQYKLDERTTSEFSNIVSGVVEGLTGAATVLPAAGAVTALGGGPVAAGATAAAFYGLQTGIDTFATNRDEGVDKGTAARMGVTSGIVNAIGMALPPALGGSRLAATAYGVLSNTGMGALERATYQTLLREHGYETRAQQYDPTDPTSLVVEGIMGGAFGALGFRKTKNAEAELIGGNKPGDIPGETVVTAPEGEGKKGKEAKKPEEKKTMTQEQTDAVRTLEVEAANKENLPVNDPEDAQSVTRATKAQQEVHGQINNKEPVDVSPEAADAEKVEALHNDVKKKVSDELKKDGPHVENEPEADVMARVSAQREEPGLGVDPANPMQVVRDAPVITYADDVPWSQQFRAKEGDSFIVVADTDGGKGLHIAIVEADEVVSKFSPDGTGNPLWLYSMDSFCSVDGHEKLTALQNMYRGMGGDNYRRELRNWWYAMCDDADMAAFDMMEHPILVTVMDSIDFENSTLNPRYRPKEAAAKRAEPKNSGKPARKTREELARERRQKEREEDDRAFEDEMARMPRPVKRELKLENIESKRKGRRGVALFTANGNHELGWLPKNVPGVKSKAIILDWDTYDRIRKRNKEELERAGYPNADSAIDDLIQTYTKIHKGDKQNSVVISKPLPNRRILYGTLYLGQNYATFGQVWIADHPNYTKGKSLLWVRQRQSVPGGVDPKDWYGARPGEVIGPRPRPEPVANRPEAQGRPAETPTPEQQQAPVAEAPTPEAPRGAAPEQTVAPQPEAPREAVVQEPPATAATERPEQARRTPANVDPALDAKAVAVLDAAPDLQVLDPETGQMVSAKELMAREDAIAKEVEDIADIGLQVAEVCAFSNGGLRDNTNG